MATTTFPANTTLHPWERNETSNLDPHGMAEIIASLGRINLTRSNRSPPDWSIVDTPQAVSNVVDIICLEVTKNGDATSNQSPPPSLYIDIQLIDNHTSTHNSEPKSQAGGSICLMQIYLLPQDHNEPGHIYLLDMLTLGKHAAFETPRSVDLDLERLYAVSPSRGAQAHNRITLKTILESPTIPKVFFDVRADAETLYHQYGISLAGVQDLQLMEFAARSICPLGSGLATSCSSASSAGGRSPIRRSSRSRSGSVTPPQHQHYPLSPPATPSTHTILDSVESSPSSVCSRESFASEASTATTVSIAISTTPGAAKTSSGLEPATPPQGTSLPLPRTRRRSLRNLNNLPRCITRDLNLPLLEQLSFSKWQTIQRKREQVAIANRELERLNKLMTPSSSRPAQSASVSHSGLPLSKQHRTKRANKESSERYQLLGLEKEVDICARPLRREVDWVRDLMGLVVLNVRYLPALWGEYDRRMRARSVAEEGTGTEGQILREREQVWRKRVEEGTRERVESARAGTGEGYATLSAGGDVSVKGRGKLVMLPPSGWD